METKIKCGEGKDCLTCKFRSLFESFESMSGFTKNLQQRCDWYSAKKAA
jgi:hypothetical protein